MRFEDLLELVADEPVFETGVLMAGAPDPGSIHRQLTRWVQAGRLVMLRRGLYLLARPYRKVEPHPFLVANRLVRGSYVSLESALAHHHLIPEATAVVTSVTTTRARCFETPIGTFVYRCLSPRHAGDYRRVQVAHDQWAFVASPEKALLELAYLTTASDSPAYVEGLRLQGLDGIDTARLLALAGKPPRPKLLRFAREVVRQASDEAEGTLAL